jgi:hypothetical protein
MDNETRQAIYNACDPTESLKPNDPRYVDLDAYGAPNEPARGLQWVDTLSRDCEFGERPRTTFLSGQRGAGLTTELRRLRVRVRHDAGASLAVGWCDADKAWDLREVPQAVELLLLIVATVARIPKLADDDAPGDDPTLQLLKEAVPELFAATERFDLAAFETLRARPALREELRTLMDGRLGAIVDHAVASLTRTVERARKAGRKGIGVVVDGFTKLDPTDDKWIDAADAAWKTLRGWCGDLPIFLWQTMPPVLTVVQESLMFPMVQVRGQGGYERHRLLRTPGITALVEVVRRRVTSEQLQEQLGPNWEERLAAVALRSSGCPADFLDLTRTLFTTAEAPIAPGTLHHLLGRRERERDLPHIMLDTADYWRPSRSDLSVAHRLLRSRRNLAYRSLEPWIGAAATVLFDLSVLAPPVAIPLTKPRRAAR